MKAVIIAGGLGTRLRPLTNNTPKPIVPVVNIPFVIHQIEHLIKHGVDEVILNLHYLSDEIKKTLGDGSRWGIKINYSIEDHPLGTAGAVKNAEQYFDDEPMVVFNGDVLTDLNISKIVAFHKQKEARVTIALTEVEDPTAFGLVLVDKDGRVKQFIEKPSWNMVTAKTINAGTYVVDPKIFKDAPKGKPYSFERELYPSLLEKGEKVYGYLTNAYWLDIGNPEKYKEAHQAILRNDVAVRIKGTRIRNKFWLGKGTHPNETIKFAGPAILGENVKVGDNTDINDYVVVGDNVKIGEHCSLERAIIWDDTKIGSHVVLTNCVIGRNCIIEDDVVVGHGIVLADGSVVKKGTKEL
jgi:glucose-1-phosphate thymidylyltransferase long form